VRWKIWLEFTLHFDFLFDFLNFWMMTIRDSKHTVVRVIIYSRPKNQLRKILRWVIVTANHLTDQRNHIFEYFPYTLQLLNLKSFKFNLEKGSIQCQRRRTACACSNPCLPGDRIQPVFGKELSTSLTNAATRRKNVVYFVRFRCYWKQNVLNFEPSCIIA
jgi:hypothetical protein